MLDFSIMRSTIAVTILVLLAAVFAAAGCTSPEERAKLSEPEIRAMLEGYLPLLAAAYATGETEPLAHNAAPKEVAIIRKKINELAAGGSTLAPSLDSFTIEDVTVWNRSNAFVTTVEIWDVQRYAVGTDQLISQRLDVPHRVKYQLKERDYGWQILRRQVEKAFDE